MSVQSETDPHELWALIKECRFPVITTRASEGGLHSQPVALCNRDGDSLEFLWFLMPKRSEPADDLLWDSAVGLTFVRQVPQRYIAVFGSAVVIEDSNLKRQLWSSMQEGFPAAQSWFPSGNCDPSVALIRLKVIRADCWDTEQHTVTHLFSPRPPGI